MTENELNVLENYAVWQQIIESRKVVSGNGGGPDQRTFPILDGFSGCSSCGCGGCSGCSAELSQVWTPNLVLKSSQ